MSYRYDSIDQLRKREREFTDLLRELEDGAATVEYTDPQAQADWFREQLRLIGEELTTRA